MTIVIDPLRRVAWGLLSLLYAALLLSAGRLPHVPIWLSALLVAGAAASALRPSLGLTALAIAVPSISFFARTLGTDPVAWAEVMTVAAAAGWSARRAVTRGGGESPSALAAAVMMAVVVSATAAAFGIRRVALGPGAWTALGTVLTRTYFVDFYTFPGLHAGLLLLEGVTLASCARWIAAGDRDALRRLAIALAAGAAIAASVNVAVLVRAAFEKPPFWPTLVGNLTYVRYNAHYRDVNAAGSFFVMALIAGLTVAAVARARLRWLLAALAAGSAAGLWTSGSRSAMAAGAVAAAVAMGWRLAHWHGRHVRAAFVVTVALIFAGGLAVSYLPIRSSQGSAGLAMTVRVEMAAAAARMIAEHPVLGVGIGEFPERVGEFVSSRLLLTFPPAAHENAHNNFLQIAAELGVVGLIAFIVFVGIAFHDAARGAAQDPLRLGIAVALAAFLITCIGGHPLLVPEAGLMFWLLLGAAGAAPPPRRSAPRVRGVVAALVVLALASTPLRVGALVADTNFEHMAIGVSSWKVSPDDIRYREARDGATLFVPANEAFAVSVQPITNAPVRIELRLDGRTADIVTLQPHAWQDLTLPARHALVRGKYSQLQLRVLDAGPETELWISKVRALGRPAAEVHCAPNGHGFHGPLARPADAGVISG